MSDTLNISFSDYAPGTFSVTYSLGGTAPNMSTGYTAAMRIWRSGRPTDSAPDVTATTASGIALGAAGSIVVNLATVNSALDAVDASETLWHYDLSVTPTGNLAQKVSSGYLMREMP